jgi:hypothetical protein
VELYYSYFILLIVSNISFSESNSDNNIPLGKFLEKNALKGMPNRSYFSKKTFTFLLGRVQSARISKILFSSSNFIILFEINNFKPN